ncbi:MAG: hypothetical protein JNL38_03785 [Myxococcales bacterium]|nr:hypothetical protein [Myxococcales bacterium]
MAKVRLHLALVDPCVGEPGAQEGPLFDVTTLLARRGRTEPALDLATDEVMVLGCPKGATR